MNSIIIDTCFRKKTPYTPVWYMRQAGRYLPEYRKLKGDRNILDIVKNAEFAAQITMLPVKKLNVDAAVLFADIMVPLIGIGLELEIVENIGPVIKNPISSIEQIKKFRTLNPREDIPYLLKTISLLKNELTVPIIGFSAAPFTLASYLIEGKPTRDFIKTKKFMYTNPVAWNLLMKKLSKLINTYINAQINQGVSLIQLFDSWVGCLSESDYISYVLPFSKEVFDNIQNKKIPTIHFGTNTAGMLPAFSSVNCNVISVDWRMPIAKCWEIIGYKKGIQGNLDPILLLSDWNTIKKNVDIIFDQIPRKKGFIFNLGHGVLPETPVENLVKLTDYVHQKLI